MISVLIPSRNYGRFLLQAIQSCLSSGHVGEVVVQDCMSTDETLAVLESLADPRVTWFREPDRGQSDALNRAYARSTGDIIAWLNADEFYAAGALDSVASELSGKRQTLLFGDSLFVDESGLPIGVQRKHRHSSFVLRNFGCYIQTCSAFFTRDAMLGLGNPWDTQLRRVMDWELFLRMERNGTRFVYHPEVLGMFRIHGDQVTGSPAGSTHPEHASVRQRFELARPGVRSWVAARAGQALHGILGVVDGVES